MWVGYLLLAEKERLGGLVESLEGEKRELEEKGRDAERKMKLLERLGGLVETLEGDSDLGMKLVERTNEVLALRKEREGLETVNAQ